MAYQQLQIQYEILRQLNHGQKMYHHLPLLSRWHCRLVAAIPSHPKQTLCQM